jgi:hypothetical protein
MVGISADNSENIETEINKKKSKRLMEASFAGKNTNESLNYAGKPGQLKGN